MPENREAPARPVAAITGASSGIGAEFARVLARDYDLILIARRAARLEELAAELPARVKVLAADLTVEAELVRVAETIQGTRGLALLVQCAGFGLDGFFWQTDWREQERMNRLHIAAVSRLAHAALANMVPRNTGAVIHVASLSAWLPRPRFIGYAATKSWMVAFSQGLALDLQAAGAKTLVQAVCPSLVWSEFHDVMGIDRTRLGKPGLWQKPEDIVAAALEGLRKRKTLVIPGRQYKVLMNVLWWLPEGARRRLGKALMRGRGE